MTPSMALSMYVGMKTKKRQKIRDHEDPDDGDPVVYARDLGSELPGICPEKSVEERSEII